MPRRFLYHDFDVLVVEGEYYITNRRMDLAELMHFNDDMECMNYIDNTYRRTNL